MQGLVEWLTGLLQHIKLWAVVNPWERAILVRCGKHAYLLEPGWHWRIPLLDSVTLFNNRLRIGTFPHQTLTTLDGKTISAAGNVGFRIVDPLAAMQSMKQPEYSCAALVQTTVAHYVFERKAAQLVVSELEECAREELGRVADGIEIDFVRITDFAVVSRAYRLFQERWSPATSVDSHDSTPGE